MSDCVILNKRAVEKIVGRSFTSIRRDVAAGRFPPPVIIGPRQVGWRSTDVDKWLRELPEGSLPPVRSSARARR